MFFKDIVGQQNIKDHLLSIAKSGKVSHAQLFVGPEGSGKLPMAIAFAQYINCENPVGNEPCGVCRSCKKMARYTHPDIIFVYPTISSSKYKVNYSINFIEHWQEALISSPYISLNEWIKKISGGQGNKQASIFKDDSETIIRRLSVKSFEAQNRVIIIWHAEKMNAVAANKILKILEEPQPNTYFILTTDTSDLLLPTILSRTQMLKFPKVNTQDILHWLTKNYPELKETQIISISKLAEGNIIRARQLVEMFLNDEKFELLELFKQLMRSAYKLNFLEINTLLQNIEDLSTEQQKEFLEYMVRMFRESYLYNIKMLELSSLTDEEKDFVKNFSVFVHNGNIETIYSTLNYAYRSIKRNANKKILWTNLIIKLGSYLRVKQNSSI